MKTCFKCSVVKPLSDFYKHAKMADGYLNKCKACTKTDVKNRTNVKSSDPEWKESERKRGREKFRRLYAGTGKANQVTQEKYIQKYPEKKLAKNGSQHLIPPDVGNERHHWSYNEEHFKDVIWMSKKHHMKSHRFIVYDQERKMYRRFDNNLLLDTKQLHRDFINYCINNFKD